MRDQIKNNGFKTSLNDLQIGDSILVRRQKSEEVCIATIVEIKRNNDFLNNVDTGQIDVEDIFSPERESSVSNANSDSESSQYIYYVHYDGMDRRLDEWVDKSRMIEDVESCTPSNLTAESMMKGKTLTRSQRRFNEEFLHLQKKYEDMDAYTAKLEREHEERTKVKNVDKIQFGPFEIHAWYFSPFPLSVTINNSVLYFCEFCLWYTTDLKLYNCHCLHSCTVRGPPGVEIYRDRNLSVFEVQGRMEKTYCQSMCLLSKLFLDHKTLYYDVDGFLFYVLCEVDSEGCHPVGHFSKELASENNLACIMVLPPYQRNGYGKLLIQFSYALSEREGVIGTPEKPLSDLGRVSYRSYWVWVLLGVLDERRVDENITVSDLSQLSGIHIDDINCTFNAFGLIKYWKGDHVVCANRKLVTVLKNLSIYNPPKLMLNIDALRWSPREDQRAF